MCNRLSPVQVVTISVLPRLDSSKGNCNVIISQRFNKAVAMYIL